MKTNKKTLTILLLIIFYKSTHCSSNPSEDVFKKIINSLSCAAGAAFLGIVWKETIHDTALPLVYRLWGADYPLFLKERNKKIIDLFTIKHDTDKKIRIIKQQDNAIRDKLSDVKKNDLHTYNKISKKTSNSYDEDSVDCFRTRIKEACPHPSMKYCDDNESGCADLINIAYSAHNKSVSNEDFYHQLMIVSGASKYSDTDQYILSSNIKKDRAKIKQRIKELNSSKIDINDLDSTHKIFITIKKEIESAYNFDSATDSQLLTLVKNACSKDYKNKDFVKDVNNLLKSNKSR